MNIRGATISFPFRGSIRGSLATISGKKDLIAEAIADVLETRQGERVMMPDYGLPDYIFSVADAGFAARLAYQLEEQIKKYVALVSDVQAAVTTDETGRAAVSVRYFERGEIFSPRNLVFPVWQLIGD